MQHATFVGVADAPIIALAKLRLGRTKLKMVCETRQQAINILRSISAPIAKGAPINIKPRAADACRKCGEPVPVGTPCKVCFNGDFTEHIECKSNSKNLNRIYASAVRYVDDVVNGPKDDTPTFREWLFGRN